MYTYTGVPEALCHKLSADAWQRMTFELLDAKGGGKATTANAAGSKVDKVDEAMELAREFAQTKLTA